VKSCKLCDIEFKRNEDRLVITGIGDVHTKCYLKNLIEKYDEKYANKKIEELIEKREEKKKKARINSLKNTEKQKDLKKERSLFIEYIQEIYDLTIPKQLMIKLANINNGTYQGLKEPIVYEDLLYMFKTKQKMLNQIYQDNVRKGNNFNSNYNRFCYDLAIILNKYDGYKKWKEKQKIIQAELQKTIEEENKQIKIDYSKIKADIKEKENDDLDIGDIIDDIY
jgi:hypothetical protein